MSASPPWTAQNETVEWITDPARFAAMGTEWDRLTAHAATPFTEHRWFTAWWHAFGAGRRLNVCALRRDGRLAAVYPLSFGGGALTAMANNHTPLFAPLAEDRGALTSITDSVLDAPASELVVHPLPDGDPALTALLRASARKRRLSTAKPYKLSPIVETTGTWEDYRRRTKSRYATLERYRRKMYREHGAEFFLVEAPADLERALDEGLRVEGSGWKGREGTAMASSHETATFYRSIARAFHATDQLRLSGISLDGRLVAFDLSLLHRDRLYLLKTGYDESSGRLAPGLVLRLAIIERCFELGLHAHELLGANAEWKRRFATADRQHYRFRCIRPRPVPVARHAYRRVRRLAARRLPAG